MGFVFWESETEAGGLGFRSVLLGHGAELCVFRRRNDIGEFASAPPESYDGAWESAKALGDSERCLRGINGVDDGVNRRRFRRR